MTEYKCEDCLDYPDSGEPCPHMACIHDHTPFPWYQQGQYIKDANGQIIANFQERDETKPPISEHERDGNTSFVLRACEQHSTLSKIADVLSGREWSADTADEIADILRGIEIQIEEVS